ncbi:MAG TPA: response regulator [Magnetovibrio sp.]
MRIVLVDDDPDLIEIMYLALQQAGHQVIAAPAGVAVMSDLHKRPPDLVITDLMMAEMDGLELCRAVRDDQALADTHVIVVSARTDPLWKTRARDAGAIGFIEKPIDPMEFAQQVDQLVLKA